MFREFLEFLRTHKAWWLAPLIIVLLIILALVLLARNNSLTPFLYNQ